MRQINLSDINENINKSRAEVNKNIAFTNRDLPKLKRRRVRDEDERKALTLIAKAALDRAKQERKFVIMDERKLYYDPSE